MSDTAKKNFTVGAISGIIVILRTHMAKGCNLKDCSLLKRNFTAELLMKHFLTFWKHLSNIGWSSNLVALKSVDGESRTPVKWKFFECFTVGELLVTYQCK